MKRKVVLLLLTGCILTSSEMLAQRSTEESRRRLAAKAEREREQYHDIRPAPSSDKTFAIGSKYEPNVESFLTARDAPSSRSRELFRIYKGTSGIEVRGDSVMNGGTEWVPITIEGQQGWVAGQFLRRQRE